MAGLLRVVIILITADRSMSDDKPNQKPAAKKKAPKDQKSTRRWGKIRNIGSIMPGVTRDTMQKRGFMQGEIITRWREIVGNDLADSTSPEKLSFPRSERRAGTLQIRVAGAAALALQHEEPQVIQRINRFFGYAAVARLKMIQAPIPKGDSKANKALRDLDLAEEQSIQRDVEKTKDPELREALAQLGRSITAADPKKRS
jgi:hypothetical protein